MLALFLIPALLGLALIIDFSNDDDDADDTPPPPEIMPEPQIVSDGFVGTALPENIVSDEDGGTISGAGGNDTITGSDLNDMLSGGPGNDVISARGGDDVVVGGRGDDEIALGAGNDVYGTLNTPNDTAGNDFVNGGRGNDFIVDLLGSNRLVGSAGNDVLIAFDGLSETGNYDTPAQLGTVDTLSGGFGTDVLAGDNGDLLTGGEGDDMFFVTDDEDTDLAEVRITDFNTEDDTLMVIQLDGLSATGPLELVADAIGVRVSYEGRAVALLEGLTTADIPNITVSLSSLAQLDDAIN